jgi:hypothetical protein
MRNYCSSGDENSVETDCDYLHGYDVSMMMMMMMMMMKLMMLATTMKAIESSDKSINFCQTVRCLRFPRDNNF